MFYIEYIFIENIIGGGFVKKIISLLLAVIMVLSVFYTVPVTAFAKEVDVAQSASSKPVITVESSNLTPYEDSFGEIVLKVREASNVSYQWQAGSIDLGTMVALGDNYAYQGTKTRHLKIKAINELDQYDYRCRITYDGGVTYSRVFRFTFLDVSLLSDVYVSGLSHPYFTQTPDYSVTTSQTDGYSVDKVEWYGPQVGVTGPLMNSTDVFLSGGYYCRIYLKPDDGYKFDDNPQLNVSIDTKTSNYTTTVNIKSDDSGNYYGDVYFIVEQDSDIAPDILDYEWKEPSDMSPNVNLGKVYLGTETMDIPFAFKIKDLPRNMALADYTVYGSTYIQCDGKSLYYTHTGDRVNLKDLATAPGRYYIYHELFLLDPEGNEIATESVCYFVNVYTPTYIMDLSVEVDEPVAGLEAEIAFLNQTEGCVVDNMYWYDITDGERVQLKQTDTFEAGHTYQVEVWLEANDGYYMNTDKEGGLNVNASINGKSAEVLSASSDKEVGFTLDFTIPRETTEPIEPSTGGYDEPTDPTEHTTETTTLTETTESTETTVTDPTETTESTETPLTDPTETTESTETTATITTETIVTTEPSSGATEPSEPDVDKGILGDVNDDGKVNIKDATMIQKFAAKIIELTDDEKLRADVNADNKNNVKDATAIQKFVAKIETGFPIGEPIASEW